MNLVLLFPSDFINDKQRVRLSGRRYKHIREILNAARGDTLRVGLINGRMGLGKIIERSSSFIELDISLDQKPPPPPAITLILALPRPIVLNRVLSAVTSLGIKRIFLFHSKQVEKTYW